MIVTYALIFAFAAVSLSLLLTMIRMVKGPRSGDRILALDTLSINAVALIILVGIAGATQIYFEAAMIIAMLGFISTVAVARFVLRGDIIE